MVGDPAEQVAHRRFLVEAEPAVAGPPTKGPCSSRRTVTHSRLGPAPPGTFGRQFRGRPTLKGAHLFDGLTATTIDVLYKVKCSIIYAALFVWSK
jgi:hypothetical protein